MSNTNEKPNLGLTAILGALSLFLVSQAAMLVNPALASLAEKYPDVPYTTITLASTLCSLLYVPSNIVGGLLAGKKVTYRTLAIISLAFTIVGGVLPYFIGGSWTMVLVCRGLMGIAAGLGFPLGSAYIMQKFNAKQAASVQGFGSLTQNLAGFVFATVAGWVCMVKVEYVWLAHLVLALPLLLVIFFVHDELPTEPVASDSNAPAASSKLPLLVIVYSLFYGLMFAVYYPLHLNVSQIMITEGFGTAAAAGTACSFYTVGGIASGFVFGPLYKACKKATFPICFAGWIAALLIGYFATSTAAYCVAICLGGLTIFCIWPATFMSFAEFVPADRSGLSAGIFSALLNTGAFCATPFCSIVASVTGSTNPRTPILAGAIVTIILAVVWTVIEYTRKPAK